MIPESKPRYTPYMGKKYHQGINGDKYLCIGGHHHCMISERNSKYHCTRETICKGTDDVECPAFQRESGCPLYNDCKETNNNIKEYNNPNLNDECKKRIKLTCETRYSIWDYVTNHEGRRPNFIFNLINEFRNELGTEIGEYDFYQYIAFANYVQIITSNERNDPQEIKMDDLEHGDNQKGFESNYNSLKPDVIVVIHFEEIKKIIKEKLPNMHHDGENFVELEGQGKYFIFAKKDSNIYKSGKFSIAGLNKYSRFIKEARSKYPDVAIASAIAYHNKKYNNINYTDTYKELNEKYGFPSCKELQSTCNSYIKRIRDGENGKPLKCYKDLENHIGISLVIT